jgi:hypothetical protein
MRHHEGTRALRRMPGVPMQGMALACIEGNRVRIFHRAADGRYFHQRLSRIFSWKVTVQEMG